MPADLVGEVIGDRDLQEMPGDTFVSEQRARVFDGRADVEVAALRVVGWDEVEAAVVGVVDARRIHEAARAGRLERLGELADLERADVAGDGDEPLGVEKVYHLFLAALIRGEERLLCGWA